MKRRSVPVTRHVRPALLIAGILLIATNLRAPITAVAPLLNMIRASFHLSTTEAGMLTTLPLLAFAAVSPFAALLAREYGLERTLFGALVVIGMGIVLRSAGTVWLLYLGTWFIGSGAAIGNVLLPSLLKRDFAGKIATLTAIYALTMGAAAAIGSVAAVPLSQQSGLGWPFALGTLVFLPLVTAILWLPQLRNRTSPAKDTATPPHGGRVWHSALAWQVTLFLGLNSFVYYIAVGWLPAILGESGYSPAQAGSLHGLLQLATALPGLMLVPVIGRMKDQRAIAFIASILSMTGFLGLLVAPAWAALWTPLVGFGTGAAIILGLAFVSLRASSSHQAAALSGMAQCIGYLLASVGPTLAGALHQSFAGWGMALTLCVLLCLVMSVFGLLAGRAIHITK
ncbi:MAG: CynX/NimT family MFS transporter [Dongiaceae bacterium]